MPKDPNEIGALWRKENDKGEYWTGTINGERVFVSPNTYKKNDKEPDLRVRKATPRVDKPADEKVPF